MATLCLSKGFMDDFSVLQPRIRNKVHEIIDQFSQMSPVELRNSKGLHLERHTNSRDSRSRRWSNSFPGLSAWRASALARAMALSSKISRAPVAALTLKTFELIHRSISS